MPKPKRIASRAKKRRMTADDLRRIRYLSDPRISPDGATVVFVYRQAGARNEYVSNLWRVDADDGSPQQFTSGGRDSHPRWSPDGSRIAFVGARDKERPQIFMIGTDGGEAVALTAFPEGTIAGFSWSPDGRTLAVKFREQDPEWTTSARKSREEAGLSDPPRVIDHWWYRLDGDGYFNGQRFHLYVVDVESGAQRAIYTKDTLGFFDFDYAPDGRTLVVATNRARRAGLEAWSDDLLRIDVASGRIKPIPNMPEGVKAAPIWSPDGKWIAYAGRKGAGEMTYSTENLELWVCDAAKGNARCLTGTTDYCLMAPPITDTGEVSFEPVIRWQNRRALLAQIGWHGECHIARIRRSGGTPEFLTRGRSVHALGNVSADGRRMALTFGTPTKLDEVHVADLTADGAEVRARTALNRDLLREVELSTPKSEWIRAEDGTKVQVWTMLPPGAGPRRRHPAVLEIHGGPHAQYGCTFFHEFQVLAAAGYAVFFSNPRGSKGYGRDFCDAIRGKWGDKDWVDLQAVIAHMQNHRCVDAKRMGVMGGSYGGYMTNWIIGKTRAFAGAITDRCVSDVVSLMGNSDFCNEPDRYFPGNHWDRTGDAWEQSPIRYIGNCRTPTLIIHSEGDLRCNVEQAEKVYTALTLLKVPTRFVRYPRSSSHGMSRSGPPDLRVHRLGQILGWWERYLQRK